MKRLSQQQLLRIITYRLKVFSFSVVLCFIPVSLCVRGIIQRATVIEEGLHGVLEGEFTSLFGGRLTIYNYIYFENSF